jgi:hypothetical protein
VFDQGNFFFIMKLAIPFLLLISFISFPQNANCAEIIFEFMLFPTTISNLLNSKLRNRYEIPFKTTKPIKREIEVLSSFEEVLSSNCPYFMCDLDLLAEPVIQPNEFETEANVKVQKSNAEPIPLEDILKKATNEEEYCVIRSKIYLKSSLKSETNLAGIVKPAPPVGPPTSRCSPKSISAVHSPENQKSKKQITNKSVVKCPITTEVELLSLHNEVAKESNARVRFNTEETVENSFSSSDEDDSFYGYSKRDFQMKFY